MFTTKIKSLIIIILSVCLMLLVFSGILIFRNMKDEIACLKSEKTSCKEKNKRLVEYTKDLQKEINTLTSAIDELEKEELKSTFEYAGYLYQVDPILLEAICLLETGRFTSDLYKTKNNAWGATTADGFMSFYNPEHSIVELARTLRIYYLDKGLTTINEIGHKYCPENEETWVLSVTQLYNEIKSR